MDVFLTAGVNMTSSSALMERNDLLTSTVSV